MMNKNLILTLMLISCSFNEKLELPNIDLPSSWERNKSSLIKIKSNWWNQFNDEKLNDLINSALEYNSDILLSMKNIDIARARLGIINSNKLPNIDLEINANRSRYSKDEFTTITTKPINDFSIGTIFNYQIDLWSKIANTSDSLRAKLLSEENSRKSIELIKINNIAKSYFNSISLRKQSDLLKEMIDIKNQIIKIKDNSYNFGAIIVEDLNNAKSELLSIEKRNLEIEQKIIEQKNILSILIGKISGNTDIQLNYNIEINIPKIELKDTPSEILEKRPDIRSKMQDIISANIDIAIAKASYFPDISLNTLIGLSSNDLSKLFSGKNWQFATNVTNPIFNYGKTKSNILIAKIEKEKKIIDYKKTIEIAFLEVYNALSALKISNEILDRIFTNVKIKEDNFDIANRKYKSGYSNKINLLNSKFELLESKINKLNIEKTKIESIIDLYTSIGGDCDS